MKVIIGNYISDWESKGYFDGIPEEVPSRLCQLNKAPSYKALCSAILKNDLCLKSLGLTPKKSKHYDTFKKIELTQRGVYIDNQLSLF